MTDIPEPHGIFATRESGNHPIEITIWQGQALHKGLMTPEMALWLAHELIGLAMMKGDA